MTMKTYDKVYIDGAWSKASGTGSFEVINSANEEVMGRVPVGTAADVDRAVKAARAAFESWSQTSVEERAAYLQKIQEGIMTRTADIAATVTGEVGMPIRLSTMIQAGLPGMVAGSYAQIVREFKFEEQVGNSLVVREPIGVVGCITPWNYPLHQIVAKVAPALAAGCTVVLKPSEVAPLSAFILAEIIDEVGLPAGVFNLVTGAGPVVGEALAAHPDVDMVSFTGSTRAGRRVAELAAPTVKRVALELGGKSRQRHPRRRRPRQGRARRRRQLLPQLRPDLHRAGPACSSRAAATTKPWQIAADDGRAVHRRRPVRRRHPPRPAGLRSQRDRVRGYIEKGIEEGATLVTGGPERARGARQGLLRPAHRLRRRQPDMTIAQEEIFGPVLSIIPYDDEDDAVAHRQRHRLRARRRRLVGRSRSARSRVARRMRTGRSTSTAAASTRWRPFGGYKQSGIGRELGASRPRGVPRDQVAAALTATRARAFVARRTAIVGGKHPRRSLLRGRLSRRCRPDRRSFAPLRPLRGRGRGIFQRLPVRKKGAAGRAREEPRSPRGVVSRRDRERARRHHRTADRQRPR